MPLVTRSSHAAGDRDGVVAAAQGYRVFGACGQRNAGRVDVVGVCHREVVDWLAVDQQVVADDQVTGDVCETHVANGGYASDSMRGAGVGERAFAMAYSAGLYG
jgi:hypothetical protein